MMTMMMMLMMMVLDTHAVESYVVVAVSRRTRRETVEHGVVGVVVVTVDVLLSSLVTVSLGPTCK